MGLKPTLRKQWAQKREKQAERRLTQAKHDAFLAGAAFHAAKNKQSVREFQDQIEKSSPPFQPPSIGKCHNLFKKHIDDRGRIKGLGKVALPKKPPKGAPPKKISEEKAQEIAEWIMARKGWQDCDATAIKRHFQLKDVSLKTIQRAVKNHPSFDGWLPRRKKNFVTPKNLPVRLFYCKKTLRLGKKKLKKIFFTDGVTFYIARSIKGGQDCYRASLKPFTWRSVHDGMKNENLRGSHYTKTQGIRVSVWGMLRKNQLKITVLKPKKLVGGKVQNAMNTERYVDTVKKKYAEWTKRIRTPKRMVQDRERCLWAVSSRKELKNQKFILQEDFPPNSGDLNNIENVWKLLREILNKNPPPEIEKRTDFVRRLHRAVRTLNTTHAQSLKNINENHENRLRQCIARNGGRTDY